MNSWLQRQQALAQERLFFPGQTGGRPQQPAFLAGQGMSMQPQGFHHALADLADRRSGLTWDEQRNPMTGRRWVGRTAGYTHDSEAARPQVARTMLSGRIERQKLNPDATPRDPYLAKTAQRSDRYMRKAPTRRGGVVARRAPRLAAGNETMLGGRATLG